MINRVSVGRFALLVVLASGSMGLAACASIANAQNLMGQNSVDNAAGSQGGDKSGSPEAHNSVDGQDTPEATETQGAGHGGNKVTGTVEAITGDTITINGTTVTVKDPALLAGLKVGDTITVELETEDGGVVVAKISDGTDDHGMDATQETTDDHGGISGTPEPGDDNGVDATMEATDDHGGMSGTPEPGDDNGVDATQEAGDDHGGMSGTPEPGDGNGGGNSGGGNSGGSGGGDKGSGKGGGGHDGGGHK